MYEDDEFEEEENSLLLADIEWPSNPFPVSWEDPNFASEMLARSTGKITEESYTKEVELWQYNLKLMPKYDEFAIRKEISSWHIGIPDKENLDYESLSVFYHLHSNYRTRLTELHNAVYANNEMLTQAYKTLFELSSQMSNAKNKYERDAYATFATSYFSIALGHTKRLLTYLDMVIKNVDFTVSQMDKMMRDFQNLARYNNNFISDGMSNLMNRTSLSPLGNKNISAEIKTRNNRLK